MIKYNLISYKSVDKRTYKICIQAKMTRKTFSKVERNTNLSELVHSNICELKDILNRRRNKYYITFIDDYSKYTYVYLIKHKEQVFQMFKNYKLDVENHKGKKIKFLSDRGREYFSMEFSLFYEENGNINQISASYTPQHNGLTRRKNRTLIDMLNYMLVNAKLLTNL
jgi:transposase InsO family protein